MNIVFITMDGARADRIIKGKNYKKIISQSAFFPKVITYAPFTISAMHAVFSGVYGFKNGVNSYWSSNNFKKEFYKTLPKFLKDTAYVTFGDSINRLVLPSVGFDELKIHDELNDNLTERHKLLLEKMEKLKQSGKKFFLYLHYSNIHTGIMQEVLKKHDNFSEEYFSNKEKNSHFYDKLFNNADEYLGEIINHFKNLGLDEDTLLVIISDHGISIGEKFGECAYGTFCYDYTMKTFAYLYNSDTKPQIISSQVRHIDFMPTILDMLNIEIESSFEKLDGESLIPLIKGENHTEKFAFSETGNPLNNNAPPKIPNTKSIRSAKWKLIHNEYNDTKELYDLVNDPNEENNLIGKNSEIEKEFSKELSKYTDN